MLVMLVPPTDKKPDYGVGDWAGPPLRLGNLMEGRHSMCPTCPTYHQVSDMQGTWGT